MDTKKLLIVLVLIASTLACNMTAQTPATAPVTMPTSYFSTPTGIPTNTALPFGRAVVQKDAGWYTVEAFLNKENKAGFRITVASISDTTIDNIHYVICQNQGLVCELGKKVPPVLPYTENSFDLYPESQTGASLSFQLYFIRGDEAVLISWIGVDGKAPLSKGNIK